MDNMQSILAYWFPDDNYKDFWFDGSKDREIYEKFGQLLEDIEIIIQKDIINETYVGDMLKTNDGKLGLIILLDQMTRNISRFTERVDYTRNDNYALHIARDMIDNNIDLEYSINKRIFILMPFRHQKKEPMLRIVFNIIQLYESKLIDNKEKIILERFKNATIKAFTNIDTDVKYYNTTDNMEYKYDIIIKYREQVLDKNCREYKSDPEYKNRFYNINDEVLYKTIKRVLIELYIDDIRENKLNVGVSLSGGVDSMCLMFIIKKLTLEKIINNCVAVHMNFGNSKDSDSEENFIKDWCKFYEIPLIVRKVTHIKRDTTDRAVYEVETKKIRFNTYKYAEKVIKNKINCFCLGHHSDDLGENVIMNIFKGRDILDLSVMDNKSIIDGVEIIRPMINHMKDVVYKFAHDHYIPYTKDTTPDWSCRGVLRRKVFPILSNQFGTGYIKHVVNLGKKSTELNILVDKFMQSILENIKYNKLGCYIDLTDSIFDNDMTSIFWIKLFKSIFYKIGVSMIKANSIDIFIEWFKKKSDTQHICSNGCICFIDNNKLYIYTSSIKNIDAWKVEIVECDIKDIKRDKITYLDIFRGYYEYTEQYMENYPIIKYNKYETMSKKDTTKKLFHNIKHLRNYLPKYSSGVFVPDNNMKIALIKISLENR